MSRIYYCDNNECGNLRFSQRPYCQACEVEMVEAPECECGAPIHARFNRQVRMENRLCMGCGRLLDDDYMRQRWIRTLRNSLERVRKEFP